MKNILVKMASRDPSFRRELIQKLAGEFTPKEWEKYQKLHPKAKKENHSIKEKKEFSKKQQKKILSQTKKALRDLEGNISFYENQGDSESARSAKEDAKSVRKILSLAEKGSWVKANSLAQDLDTIVRESLPWTFDK